MAFIEWGVLFDEMEIVLGEVSRQLEREEEKIFRVSVTRRSLEK